MKQNNMKIGKVILWIVLIIVAVIQLFPLIWLVDFSLGSSNEMFTKGLLIIPEKIRWDNYVKAFVDGNFLHYLRNSVLINTLAVIFVVIISIMAAFACQRMKWKLSGLVSTFCALREHRREDRIRGDCREGFGACGEEINSTKYVGKL